MTEDLEPTPRAVELGTGLRYNVLEWGTEHEQTIVLALNALNRILDITIPKFNEQGGTRVIPGHGRLCNESDVDDYRNWMTIVKDRVAAMVKKGMTLQQVKAAKVTLDYDGVFSTPRYTGDTFIEAVYKDLSAAKGGAARTN